MIITSPVRAALAPRQTNALSNLVSQAIGLGNSVLSELASTSTPSSSAFSVTTTITPTPSSSFITSTSSSTLSSYPSATSSATPSSASSTSSTATSASTTTAAASTTTHHTSKALTIALPIILSLLALTLFILAIWACRRRRRNKRRRTSSFIGVEPKHSSYASSDDAGLHPVSDWPHNIHTNTAYPASAPTQPMLQTAYMRESPYEPMSPAPATSSQSNPFLSPTHSLRYDTTAVVPGAHMASTSTQHHTDISQNSSQTEDTLVSQVSPVEMPAELNGDRGRWHTKPESKRSRAVALWPSRAESSKFDFGFGGHASSAAKTVEKQRFKVPRRPVGRS